MVAVWIKRSHLRGIGIEFVQRADLAQEQKQSEARHLLMSKLYQIITIEAVRTRF